MTESQECDEHRSLHLCCFSAGPAAPKHTAQGKVKGLNAEVPSRSRTWRRLHREFLENQVKIQYIHSISLPSVSPYNSTKPPSPAPINTLIPIPLITFLNPSTPSMVNRIPALEPFPLEFVPFPPPPVTFVPFVPPRVGSLPAVPDFEALVIPAGVVLDIPANPVDEPKPKPDTDIAVLMFAPVMIPLKLAPDFLVPLVPVVPWAPVIPFPPVVPLAP